VVLEPAANDVLDITSAETLDQLITTLRSAGIDFALADTRQPVIEMARRTGLLDTIGEDRIFPTVESAIQTLNATHDALPSQTL
jgi:SulP family sulfate permease